MADRRSVATELAGRNPRAAGGARPGRPRPHFYSVHYPLPLWEGDDEEALRAALRAVPLGGSEVVRRPLRNPSARDSRDGPLTLRDFAEEIGVKEDGEGWPSACPPDGNKDALIGALCGAAAAGEDQRARVRETLARERRRQAAEKDADDLAPNALLEVLAVDTVAASVFRRLDCHSVGAAMCACAELREGLELCADWSALCAELWGTKVFVPAEAEWLARDGRAREAFVFAARDARGQIQKHCLL